MFDGSTNARSTIMPAAAVVQRSNGIVAESRVLPSVSQESYGGGLDAQCALHAQYVLQLLQLQRRAGFLCDITIHVRDRSFKAHKPLLAACSLYFRALFADISTKESTALNLTSLTPDGFEVLLDYIYSGSLAITAENSSEVLSAATCLQMTNVVETCLNFMRSSFRMSKTTEEPMANDDKPPSNGTLGGAIVPEYHVTNHANKHPSLNNMLAKDLLNLQTKTAETSQQDSLQIVSTESINEAEFKSMMVEPTPHIPTLHRHAGMLSPRLLHQVQSADDRIIPSASQLQSVLPMLMNRDARQPTLSEVKRVLTGNAVESGRRQSGESPQAASNPHEIVLPTNITCTNYINLCTAKPTDVRSSQSLRMGSLTPFSSSVYFPAKSPSAMKQVHKQNGIVQTPMSTGYKVAYSGKNVATVSPAVNQTSTPEHYSGITQAASTGYGSVDRDVVNHPPLQRRNSAAAYSSDEQGNSVEISSDDESDAWSADRSALSSTDLSGTPCAAAVQSTRLGHTDAPLNLTNTKAQTLPGMDLTGQTKVSKTQSLPHLSSVDQPSAVTPYSRALSTDGRTQIITYEKATSAMTALSCSPCTSVVDTSPSESDHNGQETVHSDDIGLPAEKLTAVDEKDVTSCAPPIVMQVIRKNLLPTKSGTETLVQSSPFVLPWQTDTSQTNALPDYYKPVDMVKVEEYGNEIMEADLGAFPVPGQDDGQEYATDFSRVTRTPLLSPEGAAESETSRYSADDPNEDEEALDLSVPQPRSSQSSPEKSNLSPFVTNSSPGAVLPPAIPFLSNVDPGTKLAADALSLLSQSYSKVRSTSWNDEQASSISSDAAPDSVQDHTPKHDLWSSRNSNSQASDSGIRTRGSFSRKPRRTTGGQTCMWPGCGRLFRHRNIYDEHQRLHELGVPVSQLRKCYMGARVKKTVREQLEELRTNDSVFDGGTEGANTRNTRVRKRKSTSETQEPIRKRVNVKDRVGPFQLSSQNVTISQPPAIKPSVPRPAGVVHLPAPPPVSCRPPQQFLRPPAPSSQSRLVQVVGSDGIVRLAQTNDARVVPARQAVLSPNQQRVEQAVMTTLQPQPTATSATNAQQIQKVNPVEATLALLGIRTPVRRNIPSSSAFPIATVPMSLSIDQMRRRLAIRETSNDVAATSTILPTHTVMVRSPYRGGEKLTTIAGPPRVPTIPIAGKLPNPPAYALMDMYPTASHGVTQLSTGAAQSHTKTNPGAPIRGQGAQCS